MAPTGFCKIESALYDLIRFRRERGLDVYRAAPDVYACLLRYRNSKTNLCCPKQTTIADTLGVSVSTVLRAVTWLERVHLIKRVRVKARDTGFWSTTRYYFSSPATVLQYAKEHDRMAPKPIVRPPRNYAGEEAIKRLRQAKELADEALDAAVSTFSGAVKTVRRTLTKAAVAVALTVIPVESAAASFLPVDLQSISVGWRDFEPAQDEPELSGDVMGNPLAARAIVASKKTDRDADRRARGEKKVKAAKLLEDEAAGKGVTFSDVAPLQCAPFVSSTTMEAIFARAREEYWPETRDAKWSFREQKAAKDFFRKYGVEDAERIVLWAFKYREAYMWSYITPATIWSSNDRLHADMLVGKPPKTYKKRLSQEEKEIERQKARMRGEWNPDAEMPPEGVDWIKWTLEKARASAEGR